jgi:hypothetical protein
LAFSFGLKPPVVIAIWLALACNQPSPLHLFGVRQGL